MLENSVDSLNDLAAAKPVTTGKLFRQYIDASDILSASGKSLRPSIGFHINSDGRYLLHTTADGCPHCYAVVVESGAVSVYDGNHCYALSIIAFRDMCTKSVDKSSLVTFTLTDGHQ